MKSFVEHSAEQIDELSLSTVKSLGSKRSKQAFREPDPEKKAELSKKADKATWRHADAPSKITKAAPAKVAADTTGSKSGKSHQWGFGANKGYGQGHYMGDSVEMDGNQLDEKWQAPKKVDITSSDTKERIYSVYSHDAIQKLKDKGDVRAKMEHKRRAARGEIKEETQQEDTMSENNQMASYTAAIQSYADSQKIVAEETTNTPEEQMSSYTASIDQFVKAPMYEKTLTAAELKKREEIAKAMERENPGMDKSKKMAIATAAAKRVAEERALDEAKADSTHTFHVGDVVDVNYHNISGKTHQGTANVDKSTSSYVHVKHPVHGDLIKFHQGINNKGGQEVGTIPGSRQGGFVISKKSADKRVAEETTSKPQKSAWASGYEAYHKKGVTKNPHKPGSDEAKDWNDAWDQAKSRSQNEEVDIDEADKHSFIGRIQRHQELKKKVDNTWKDSVDAENRGDKAGATKSFLKHVRYTNLERPGTWKDVKEETNSMDTYVSAITDYVNSKK